MGLHPHPGRTEETRHSLALAEHGQESVDCYHASRPHQGLDNELIAGPKYRGRPKTKRGDIADQVVPLAEVRCQQRLGGLLKSYRRAA